jgi:phospholipase/carboxylesterase
VPTRISQTITFSNGWFAQVQKSPDKTPGKVIILIHGWSGDEQSMNIFVRNFDQDFLMISPRGPVNTPQGGYGWVPITNNKFPRVSEFLQVSEVLATELKSWVVMNGYKPASLNLMGFSQGACMAYTLSILYKELFGKTACLSGYLPSGLEAFSPDSSLIGKKYFIAHGTLDETVPVELARKSVKSLNSTGAEVNYCEENVGHKLSLPCFKALEDFFKY